MSSFLLSTSSSVIPAPSCSFFFWSSYALLEFFVGAQKPLLNTVLSNIFAIRRSCRARVLRSTGVGADLGGLFISCQTDIGPRPQETTPTPPHAGPLAACLPLGPPDPIGLGRTRRRRGARGIRSDLAILANRGSRRSKARSSAGVGYRTHGDKPICVGHRSRGDQLARHSLGLDRPRSSRARAAGPFRMSLENRQKVALTVASRRAHIMAHQTRPCSVNLDPHSLCLPNRRSYRAKARS